MSSNRRGNVPKRDEAYKERVTAAAAALMKSYTEPGAISKRGAIQSEAWHRFRSALDLPDDPKVEKKRELHRKLRASKRRKERPYPTARVEAWFSGMMKSAFEKAAKDLASDEQ